MITALIIAYLAGVVIVGAIQGHTTYQNTATNVALALIWPLSALQTIGFSIGALATEWWARRNG